MAGEFYWVTDAEILAGKACNGAALSEEDSKVCETVRGSYICRY